MAKHALVGLTVSKVRKATRAEREASGVDDDRETRVVEFADGTCLLALADDEGNGFGTLLHIAPSESPMGADGLKAYYV